MRDADPAALALLYRIIDRQQLHDHSFELRTLSSESGYRLFGMATALIVTALLCVSAIYAIYTDHPAVAAIFGGSTVLTSVAGLFVRGRALQTQSPAPTQETAYPAQQRPTQPPPRPS